MSDRLSPVRVDPSRVIRTVVGLRPYRPSGFRVEPERFDDTLVVHNYGHGGGGVTLSWGSAHLAVQALEGTEGPVAVLGCGVLGLSTARLLQARGRGVTIYAADLPPNTTSNVAGAQWAPVSVVDRALMTAAFDHQFEEAARFSYRYFQNFLGRDYGVRWRDNYFLRQAPGAASWEMQRLGELFADQEQLGPGEHPFPAPYVRRVATMHIEPAPYLRALVRDVLRFGGRIVVRTFDALEQVLALDERVVVNCTGLGAGALFGDHELTPVKGQLHVLRPQPDVDYIMITGGLYMMPRTDGILLGGTFQRGEWSLESDAAEERRILEGHARLFGAMGGAG